jgi:hypothetical protein
VSRDVWKRKHEPGLDARTAVVGWCLCIFLTGLVFLLLPKLVFVSNIVMRIPPLVDRREIMIMAELCHAQGAYKDRCARHAGADCAPAARDPQSTASPYGRTLVRNRHAPQEEPERRGDAGAGRGAESFSIPEDEEDQPPPDHAPAPPAAAAPTAAPVARIDEAAAAPPPDAVKPAALVPRRAAAGNKVAPSVDDVVPITPADYIQSPDGTRALPPIRQPTGPRNGGGSPRAAPQKDELKEDAVTQF